MAGYYNELIRACSNGSVRIDTPAGIYYLSRREIRTLLFFGNRVPLRQAGGIANETAIARPFRNGDGILIVPAHQAYHIRRSPVVLVATGTLAPNPMTSLPTGV
jgi:hypothetical protein